MLKIFHSEDQQKYVMLANLKPGELFLITRPESYLHTALCMLISCTNDNSFVYFVHIETGKVHIILKETASSIPVPLYDGKLYVKPIVVVKES